jgi:hypothetical protein
VNARGAFWLGYVAVVAFFFGYLLSNFTWVRFFIAVGACIAYAGVWLMWFVVAEELRTEGEPPL